LSRIIYERGAPGGVKVGAQAAVLAELGGGVVANYMDKTDSDNFPFVDLRSC